MAFLEGKTPTEKKKLIAAAGLGLVALVALYLAFGRTFFGGTTSATTTKSSATPTPGSRPSNRPDASLPTVDEQNQVYETTPVVYPAANAYAPDAGRNIFAFYEPGLPCTRNCPTPIVTPPPFIPPSPTPTPPIYITSFNPASLYAGSKGFRLEVIGERFSPDAHIYFSQTQMPTTFINPQKLVADIPANLIAQEGPRGIIIQTPDGKLYSNQIMMTIQAPPKPTVQYIGMIGRKRYNNDTAYFTENEKSAPFGLRLNDVQGGRFRLVAIDPAEVTFQDVDLGFKHRIPLSKPVSIAGTQPARGGVPNDSGFVPFNPNAVPQGNIPGIPNNIQRFKPGQPAMEAAPQQKEEKKDVDDNAIDDG